MARSAAVGARPPDAMPSSSRISGTSIPAPIAYDPATRGGDSPDGRKVQGTIHWVSATHALDCELRLYDKLFTVPNPEDVEDGQDFLSVLNPDSLVVMRGAKLEPSVASDPIGMRYQFERTAYFVGDVVDSKPGALVFNRTVTLRDSWQR